MSKFILLLTSAYVNGALRHPDEGVLHLDDDEAQRLLDNESGKDVSADFAEAAKDVPVMALDAASSSPDAAVAMAADAVPHQSEIPAVPTTDTPPADDAAGKPSKEKAK